MTVYAAKRTLMTLGGRVISLTSLAVKSLPAHPKMGERTAGIVSREAGYNICNLCRCRLVRPHSSMAKRAGQPGAPEYGANVPRPVD
jgi:hypothetical protein